MANEKNPLVESIGSSIFWILVTVLSAGGLLYMLIWSLQNDSLKGVILSMIFLMFIVMGLVLSKFKVFSAGTWGQNCLSVTIGFIIWLFVAGQQKTVAAFSLFSVSQNALYATIVGTIPQSLNFVMNTLVIPVAEEMFWLFGITFVVLSIVRQMSKKYDFLENIWIQIAIVSAISGITFATFHVGKASLSFVIAAVIFRTTLAVLILGDGYEDIIPYITVGWAFGLGAHIGNNWGVFGWSNGLAVLSSSFWTFGWIVYLFMILIGLTAVGQIGMLVKKAFENM